MIAYGRLIDTRVEISTLSETNNAQFFLNLKVVRFIATRTAASVNRVSSGLPICSAHLLEPKTLLKTGEPDEPEFLDPWSQQM
jgi:hypothetical protein